MTDNDAHRMDLKDARNAAPRGNEPADGWVDADEDQALLRTLHQAVALHYPVPDPDAAWQRMMARRALTASPTIAPMPLQRDTSSTLPMAVAPLHTASRTPPSPAPVRWRSPWRSVAGVLALAAVMVLGLLGSIRGLVDRSPFQAQPGGSFNTFSALSSDQEVLALDPEGLVTHLGFGWSLRSASAEVGEVLDPMIAGLLGSTRLVYRGPDKALIIVEVQPVAAAPSAMTSAWSWTDSDGLFQMGRLDPATRSREPATVAGCRQATHIEGKRKADPSLTIGFTQCAVNSSEILMVTTSGEVLGNMGWTASDPIATLLASELANAPIVPTHRFEHRGTAESGLYQHALIDAPLVQPLAQGTLLRWTGHVSSSPAQANKTPWLEMRTADGVEGWVPADSLFPAVEGLLPEGYVSSLDDAFVADGPTSPTPELLPRLPNRVISIANQPLLALLHGKTDAPDGLILENQFERTQPQVAAALRDPEEATQLLDAWGWKGNVLREFVQAPGAEQTTGETDFQISLHRFADADAAASALTYFSDDARTSLDLRDRDVPPIGETTRLLAGAPDGSPLVLLYVQRNDLLYQIKGMGNDASGDPTGDMLEIAHHLMASYDESTPSPVPAP